MIVRPLATSPRLFVVDEFASLDETAHVLALASDRSALEQHADGYAHDSASFVAELRFDGDAVLRELAARMSALVGLANDESATLRLRAYVPGESHPLHSDAHEHEGLSLLATAMLYVLEPERGGATCFPAARPDPIRVTPRRGRLLVWFNHREDGWLDPHAVHEALPVAAGYKIVLNDFFYAPSSACRRIPSLPICREPGPTNESR